MGEWAEDEDWFWDGDDAGADEDGPGDESGTHGGVTKDRRISNRDGIIFVVDVRSGMREKLDDKGTQPTTGVTTAMACVSATMKNKVIGSDKDGVGVVLVGTRGSKNQSDFPGIHVLQPLDMVDAPRIMEIEAMAAPTPAAIARAEAEWGSGDAGVCSMVDVLWVATGMFAQCPLKFGTKSVLIITTDDAPHDGDSEMQAKMVQKTKDMASIGIMVDVVPVTRPHTPFDMHRFYGNLLADLHHHPRGTEVQAPLLRPEDLINAVRRKTTVKRALQRLPLRLAHDLELSVSVYNLVQPATKAGHVWLDQDNNKEMATRSNHMDEDTGEFLMVDEILHSFSFGGESAVFTKQELAAVKSVGCTQAGIQLLGFKPRKYLRRNHTVKSTSFLYPNNTISGSTTLFVALCDSMQVADSFALCVYTRSKAAAPSLVALVAQGEVVNDVGDQVTPPGMHLIHLPFADDMRDIELEEAAVANPAQVDKAKEIISALTARFDSNDFENPSLQRHYAYLQALALDKESPEEVVDTINPDIEGMEATSGHLVRQFRNLVYPPGYVPGKAPAKRKHDAGAPAAKPPKKAKAEYTKEDLVHLIKNGGLSKLTVADMKAFLKAEGVKAATRKGDLVEQVEEHVNRCTHAR